MLVGGHAIARAWATGVTGIAGNSYAVGSGALVTVGGSAASVGISEFQSGTGFWHLGAGELTIIGFPTYRSQVTNVFAGAGGGAFNGAGNGLAIGNPIFGARVVNANFVAANDYFLGGEWE